jgi:hypothetical protein
MNPQQVPMLERRIKELRDEIEAIIASRVETVAQHSPGVPTGVIRNLLIARSPGCACAQYLDLCRDGALKP